MNGMKPVRRRFLYNKCDGCSGMRCMDKMILDKGINMDASLDHLVCISEIQCHSPNMKCSKSHQMEMTADDDHILMGLLEQDWCRVSIHYTNHEMKDRGFRVTEKEYMTTANGSNSDKKTTGKRV
jgi:hypothetical protein